MVVGGGGGAREVNNENKGQLVTYARGLASSTTSILPVAPLSELLLNGPHLEKRSERKEKI